MPLSEVSEFTTDQEFARIKQTVYELVAAGELVECGLDPADSWHLVEVFRGLDGSEWKLAVPDHAFRGYLRKIK
jgi:hypothetical protein